jgi:hypothetical protein
MMMKIILNLMNYQDHNLNLFVHLDDFEVFVDDDNDMGMYLLNSLEMNDVD